tara:strand:+ start:121259 stop:121654 length:396 start_codon:yes stop_codon:yes gene_type:complete
MNLSKKSKIILSIIIVIIITVFVVYKYSMQPPAKIESKKVDFIGSSDELLSKIQQNAAEWQDKVVVISGKITDLDDKGFMLSSSIYCQLRDSLKVSSLTADQNISIKGRIIGYDDLLEELKLDQCIIQQQP